jgi:hypothetical protein
MIGLGWLAICLTIGLPLVFAIYRAQRWNPPLEEMLNEWQRWLPDGLLGGLRFGMMLAVLFASASAVASGRNAIASLVFGLSGNFPRRPAQFLEWARNTGLLRVTGVAYQFRHDTYQQWLAAGGGNRDVTARPDPPADARFGLSKYETGGGLVSELKFSVSQRMLQNLGVTSTLDKRRRCRSSYAWSLVNDRQEY